jgi:hypothetical protein
MRMVSEKLKLPLYRAFLVLIFAFTIVEILVANAVAQQTGSIAGKVSSAAGAAISGARVIITNKSTGQTSTVKTDPAGAFISPALAAGDYALRVAARSFLATTVVATVQAGAPTAADIKLDPEPLAGIVPVQKLGNLPANGLDSVQYAQLEPGIQNQDGATIDPSKAGFPALSLDNRSGRATRVQADGLDIHDETVGATTTNIPASAVQELQLGGLSAPISDQLTAGGALNVVTRSGSNDLHAELFGFYRNGDVLSASLPGGNGHAWGRQQFGGNLGGALIHDKLYFFLDGERNRQDLANPILLGGPFTFLSPSSTTIREPFREIETTDRLDYQLSETARAFYRFTYDQSSDVHPFGSGPSLQPFLNRTNTPSHAIGVDFTTGAYTHNVRFQYLKFRNVIADSSGEVGGVVNPVSNVAINIGGGATSQCAPGSLFCSGPSFLAPQQNYQSDQQFRYDGSHLWHNHIFHYGASYNRILAGRFASLFSTAPTLSDQGSTPLPANVFGSDGNPANVLNYPVEFSFIGNGLGFATERSEFGLPGGGQRDNQVMLYVGDTWKAKPNLSVTYGVRWIRDTGRTDSDLGPIPQLNAWGAGLGNRVRQPNLNFAPQLGLAWEATDKTILRGGLGLFYDSSIFNNDFFDRPLRLPQGSFISTPAVCIAGAPGRIQWPSALTPGSLVANGAGIVNSDGTVSPYDATNLTLQSWCGESISSAAPLAAALQQAYIAATTAAGSTSNPSYIGNAGAFAGPNQNGLSLLAPNFRTPRTLQVNASMQHELRPGLMFTLGYQRDVSTRTLLGVDVNHGGAASTFNLSNAIFDRDAAQVGNGCLTGTGQVGCMVANLGPAGALAAYGKAGIGGPAQVTGGAPCPQCAFPGLNPSLGVNVMNFPEGRSVYNGINVILKQQVTNFSVRGVQRASFQASYSHSRYVSQSQDSDLASQASDFANPNHFTGPAALDRTHQVSLAANFDLRKSVQLSFIGHFDSPLPVTLSFQQTAGAAEVLVTDWRGDGTTGDIIPGSSVGSYMRSIKPSGLQNFIKTYNTSVAASSNPQTPAGNALINGGVFSLQELEQTGGVLQPLASTVSDVAGLGWLKTFDLKLGWEHKFQDRFSVEPSVGLFNLFNFANFDLPGNTQSGVLSFGAGSLSSSATVLQPQSTVGGTSPTGSSARTNRTSLLSGMNAAGAPRSIEWRLRISF